MFLRIFIVSWFIFQCFVKGLAAHKLNWIAMDIKLYSVVSIKGVMVSSVSDDLLTVTAFDETIIRVYHFQTDASICIIVL